MFILLKEDLGLKNTVIVSIHKIGAIKVDKHFFYLDIFHFDFVFLDIKDFVYCFFDIEHTVMLNKLCIVFAQDREIKNVMDEIVNEFGRAPHLIRTLLEASVNLGKAVDSLLGESVSGLHVFN